MSVTKKKRLQREERRQQYIKECNELAKTYDKRLLTEFICCKTRTELILRAYGNMELPEIT